MKKIQKETKMYYDVFVANDDRFCNESKDK